MLKFVLELVVMDTEDSRHRQKVVTHVSNGRPRLHNRITELLQNTQIKDSRMEMETIAETLMEVIRFGAILQTQM